MLFFNQLSFPDATKHVHTSDTASIRYNLCAPSVPDRHGFIFRHVRVCVVLRLSFLSFFLEFASLLDCIELDCRACTVNFLSHPALFLSRECTGATVELKTIKQTCKLHEVTQVHDKVLCVWDSLFFLVKVMW